jgi:hypothetical protein
VAEHHKRGGRSSGSGIGMHTHIVKIIHGTIMLRRRGLAKHCGTSLPGQ